MELLIVLFILVILAGVSTPAFMGTLRAQRLQSAAEGVRTDWGKARNLAMKTGRIHVYRFENGGRRFEVIPWISDDDALESATNADAQSATFSTATAAGTDAGGVAVEEGPGLPEGVIFVGGEASADPRGLTAAEAISGGGVGTDGGWGAPIMFYPDGSATDAYVIVANDQQQAIRVELRGLTGLATVGEMTRLEELVQ